MPAVEHDGEPVLVLVRTDIGGDIAEEELFGRYVEDDNRLLFASDINGRYDEQP